MICVLYLLMRSPSIESMKSKKWIPKVLSFWYRLMFFVINLNKREDRSSLLYPITDSKPLL